MHIYDALLLSAILTNSLLIVILAVRRDRTLTLISFFTFICLINCWAIPLFLINYFNIQNGYFAHLDKIAAIGYTFIPVAFFVFTLGFAGRMSLLRKYSVLGFTIVPAFVFLYLSWNTNLIEYHDVSHIIHANWGLASAPGKFFLIFLAWFVGSIIYSLRILYLMYEESVDPSRKRQIFWVMMAIVVPLSIGSVTDGILPSMGRTVFPMGISLTSIMAIFIFYAIVKHELFEFSPLTILSSIGDGVITINRMSRIVLVNESAEKMLGVTSKDLIGGIYYRKVKLVDEVGNTIPKYKRPVAIALRNKKIATSTNYYVMPKNGVKFPVAFTVAPVIRNKKLIGATVNFRDISGEKELERNKDDFISVASHELKTPITALKLYIQLLERQLTKTGDKKHMSSISKINYQADRLTSLVGNLLNVSRMETGKFIYNKKKCKIEDLVKDALLSVKQIARGRRIIRKGKSSKFIFGDAEKLSEVLVNLITNAIKYSPRNKEIVIITTTTKTSVTISVKDFGIGISRTDQSKIFDRLYQAENKKATRGLGMGLYVSRQIIKDHGGSLSVESKLGKGSVFSFMLPLSQS